MDSLLYPSFKIYEFQGGLNVNKPNKKFEYPIELAIRFNKVEVVKAMVKCGNLMLDKFDHEYCPLIDACEKDLTEIGLILIEAGAKINTIDRDLSPLIYSVSNNNEILTAKLVEKGANLFQIDSNGNSVVHLAVLNENEFIMTLLLKFNAPKDLLNYDNLSPLDLAKINESEEFIKLLNIS